MQSESSVGKEFSDYSVNSSKIFKKSSQACTEYIPDFDMSNEPKEETHFKEYLKNMTEKNIQAIKQSSNKKFRMAWSSHSNLNTFDELVDDYENGIVEEFEESPRISLNSLVKSDSIKNYEQKDWIIKKIEKWVSWNIVNDFSPFGPRIHSSNEIEQK